MKPSGPGLLFVGRFLTTVSISLLVIGLFVFYISSWFSLRRLYLSKNLSISSRLSILLVCSCLRSSLRILSISAVSVVTSPFSFLILLILVLSLFFLMSLAKDLSILFIFSKNELLVLLIFAIVFFVSISLISALIFMISFLLLTLGFLCSSFSSSFSCKVVYLRCFLFQRFWVALFSLSLYMIIF